MLPLIRQYWKIRHLRIFYISFYERKERRIYHLANGDFARVSASAAAIYGEAHMTGVDKRIGSWMKTTAVNSIQAAQIARGRRTVSKMFKVVK